MNIYGWIFCVLGFVAAFGWWRTIDLAKTLRNELSLRNWQMDRMRDVRFRVRWFPMDAEEPRDVLYINFDLLEIKMMQNFGTYELANVYGPSGNIRVTAALGGLENG